MHNLPFDPNLPAGATYSIQPGHHRRTMKSRLVGILKEHQHRLLDAVNMEEAHQARELIADAIIEELP